MVAGSSTSTPSTASGRVSSSLSAVTSVRDSVLHARVRFANTGSGVYFVSDALTYVAGIGPLLEGELIDPLLKARLGKAVYLVNSLR